MARTYKRDSRGRFAGGGGGSNGRKAPVTTGRSTSKPSKPRGLLIQRTAVTSSRKKLAAIDPADQSIKATLSRRAQKGAVTRAKNALAAAQKTGRRKVEVKGRKGVIRVGKGRKEAPVATPTVAQPKTRRSSSAARGERIISRFQAIGQGRTGRKARQAQIVKNRAETFYRGLAPSVYYERGSKAGQQRPRAEVLSGLVKNLQDRKRVRNSRLGSGPASGIRQRVQQQNRRGNIYGRAKLQVRAARTGLGPMSESQYRQYLSYSRNRPSNKVETSVAVRRRAMEFLANPRSGQKLPALSRPAPQRKATAPASKPSQPTSSRSGVKLDAFQRSEAKYAKRKYGVHSTISNPGRKSRAGKMVTTSTGQRVRTTGRTLAETRSMQTRRTKRLLAELGPKRRTRYRKVRGLPQLNIFGGSSRPSQFRPAPMGPTRRFRTRGSGYSNSAPTGRYS